MNIIENDIVSLAALLGSWVIVTGGIWKLFDRIEGVAAPEAKKSVSQWLLRLDLENHFIRWADTFSEAFDTIFGTRHLSWRCFYRSAIASLIAVLVMTLFWAYLRPEQFMAFIDRFNTEVFGWMLIASVSLNLIPDYLSLLESRYIISLLRNSTSMPEHIALIVLDFIATFLIALIALLIFIIFVDVITFDGFLAGFLSNVLPLSSPGGSQPSFGIWFYSTFFTSVWVWIYILSGILLSTRKPIDLFITKFKRFFDVEKKPFLSMGGASILVITAMYLVIIPVVFVLKGD
ncbi:hypothetical protein [Candidatus Thiosymbion oneisti]|uniref:hypothetical protein n=1 Tax=Candidatus Thiosymbion oneisti TaxID=589554 RepID=UPI000B7DEC06|nr:hypothetical protein [Candidatus Thiosymbion oneisti]